MQEAIDGLEIPRVKTVRPFKTYSGPLTLGDPEINPNAMSIDVERYFKTHRASIPQASRVVLKAEAGLSQSSETLGRDEMEGVEPTGGDFSALKQSRSYKVNDPAAPGGKRDVNFEDLAKGYEYGRTAVHISESEYNITKIETTASFSIVGFINQEMVSCQLQLL